jgi:amylosucrase/maltose alpha-D-glucosyltransferase/alpha-amylase
MSALTPKPEWIERQSRSSFERILPRLRDRFTEVPEPEWQVFTERMEQHFHPLFELLYELYSGHYDFFYHLESIVTAATRMWVERPTDLKGLDAQREATPDWYRSNQMIGYIMYADHFAGNLDGIREKIPFLRELGVNYLHIMPPFKCPEGDNDGGYAISSYREIDAKLGTMEDLARLATDLRAHGVSLCVDFVYNHTSDEHEWAKKALSGDAEYQDYYRMYDDREMPDRFEQTVNTVFPEEHPGCFTYRSRIRKWVWTTFKNYQWDLNYENPVVFSKMAEEMLFLANQGVEVLRLDAVAFLWKEVGTNCENLSQAHKIIQAFNLLIRITAPALVFKSEAIVHPDEVAKYIDPGECQLSYNPTLMALLWNAVATRKVEFLTHTMMKRFTIHPDCAWVNYIRCHDDIGWTFSNEDASEVNINADDHRHFLVDFYTAKHEASFAKGLPFQENPHTGDARISGATASLAGLEKAIAEEDEEACQTAVRRILLMYGVTFTIGGIPLIYAGDSIGTLNDYGFLEDPDRAGDSRWVHRPIFDWNDAEKRLEEGTYQSQIFNGILRLAQVRRSNAAFDRTETEIVDTQNEHVFAYFRHHPDQTALMLANFSDFPTEISGTRLRQLGLRRTLTDLMTGQVITASQTLEMEGCRFMVLVGVHR